MKIFAFLFSFYILALSVVPCTDQAGCGFQTEQTDNHSKEEGHHHDSESKDHCTPFCVCTCCSQAFNHNFYKSAITERKEGVTHECPAYTSSFISEIFFQIWQPPKIS
ncbi:MAG: hypothetical protein IT268_03305 [Saprospiraceae bacterium]|nr:hypothetical protein [Saprospiraceae bacterium]